MDGMQRAQRHAALGDERRLAIVDHLAVGDRTVAQLADLVDIRGNLLAHHLDVLDHAGLIERRVSEGDHRRRYVSLRWDGLPVRVDPGPIDGRVVFVCTHNSARSQFAAALWENLTGAAVSSAGIAPADQVHPRAVQVALDLGVDMSQATPSGYNSLRGDVDCVISVCDKANEAPAPRARERLHWSIPDPVPVGTVLAFRTAFEDIANRIQHVVGGAAA